MQSVAVKLLVEREREIRAFVPEESWKITANLDYETPFSIELSKLLDKKISLKNFAEVEEFLKKYNIDSQNIKTTKDKK